MIRKLLSLFRKRTPHRITLPAVPVEGQTIQVVSNGEPLVVSVPQQTFVGPDRVTCENCGYTSEWTQCPMCGFMRLTELPPILKSKINSVRTFVSDGANWKEIA